MTKIVTTRWLEKRLERLPKAILEKFHTWVNMVQLSGVRKMREHRGYHDEPLLGARLGQRSVRLNRAWRVIYVEHHEEGNTVIEVIEVNKHDY